jgi:hypothetical protein
VILLLAGLAGLCAGAEPLRVGIFVGDDEGATGDQRLLFAASDARKMRDLFVEYGQIADADATLLQNVPRRQVEEAFTGARRKLLAAEAQGRETSLIFYYSGHGDEDSLHLGTTSIAHLELRAWMTSSGADLTIGMLDACQSGGAVRAKGGVRGPAYDFDLHLEQMRGTAILTSSAANETSQESSEVGGGFFTHYLHSGLRGAADMDRDGEVTLTEANAYVHGATMSGTQNLSGTQTPGFDFDLVGSGDVALTALDSANANLAFLGNLSGTYAVWDEARKRYVAEVNGTLNQVIALRPGNYVVQQRMPGWVEEAAYTVRREETRSVYPEDFQRVSYTQSASRGELARQERRARVPDLALRGVFAIRAFGSDVANTWLPPHPVTGIEARLLSPIGRMWYGFDLLTGGGQGTLDLAGFGERKVTVGSTSLGGAVGFATKPWLLRAGVGGRAEWVSFRRRFDDLDVDPQAELSVAPGVALWAGLHLGRFQLDLSWAQLWYAGAFDDHVTPSYAEPALSIGYRF